MPKWTRLLKILSCALRTALFLALLGAGRVSAQIPGATITPITVPSGVSFWHIAAATDGSLWVSDIGNTRRLGRIAADGTFTGYPLTGFGLNPLPYSLTTGPDGNVWFTVALTTLDGSPAGGAIGRMTPSGTMTAFPVPTGNAFDNAYGLPITQGPDGNIWFCEQTAGKIAKITTSGTITEYQIPTNLALPTGIAGGPDGNVWFVEYGGKVGRITPSGAITEFPVGGGGSAGSSSMASATAPTGTSGSRPTARPGARSGGSRPREP
jgi:virginiamycin B lyase